MKRILDKLYNQYNKREYVHPDPLEFLYAYKEIEDREIVALIASSLAYGNVAQILKSVSSILHIINPSPYLFVKDSTYRNIRKAFKGFRHRFAGEDHISALIKGIKHVINRFGSLNECFFSGLSPEHKNVVPAMSFFSRQLTAGNIEPGHLVARPEKGSACKRMNLFLRWMVRQDEVDPGGWLNVPPSKLIIPVDTHIHRISLALGLTNKRQANMNTALEITSRFKQFVPHDPVRYDFVITRLGIRNDMDVIDFINTARKHPTYRQYLSTT